MILTGVSNHAKIKSFHGYLLVIKSNNDFKCKCSLFTYKQTDECIENLIHNNLHQTV